MKVCKLLYTAGLILSLGVTLLLLVVWWRRNAMPYNESGRYHDGSVIFNEQAVGVYAVLVMISIFVNIVIAVRYRNLSK